MTVPTRGGQATARVDLEIWSTTATLVVTDPGVLDAATADLVDVLAEVDACCSRFRPDSELNRILSRPGRPARLSPMLNGAVGHALRVAVGTGYLVDPTVAAAVIAAGYDRDFSLLLERGMTVEPTVRSTTAAAGTSAGAATSQRAPGAWNLVYDPTSATLTVPAGVGIDLGATAKAFAADVAAARIAGWYDGGVLVGIGGDIAVAGRAPDGGWRIAVADDHRAETASFQTVSIESGGLATSSTTVRRWRTLAGWRHHIIDPRTGRNPDSRWRTVSVAAASCVDANAAATAAVVLGDRAPDWLAGRGLPALLVGLDGSQRTVAEWPDPEVAA